VPGGRRDRRSLRSPAVSSLEPVSSVEPAAAAGTLAARRLGAGDPLVLAHGFTLNAGAWGPMLEALAGHRSVVAVDLPGHGGSSAVTADLPGTARMVAETGGRADYVGYSLGGRVCLHVGLSRPDVVRRLVLVGASAGIVDDGERSRRRHDDEALADELERSARHDGERVAMDRFLDRWLSGPLFASLDPGLAQLEARRRNTVAGLASSLRTCGVGTQAPLWVRLHELDMAVLVVAGATDERYGDIGRRMVEAIGPNASLALVPEAGHACHLERPATTVEIIEAFFDQHP